MIDVRAQPIINPVFFCILTLFNSKKKEKKKTDLSKLEHIRKTSFAYAYVKSSQYFKSKGRLNRYQSDSREKKKIFGDFSLASSRWYR